MKFTSLIQIYTQTSPKHLYVSCKIAPYKQQRNDLMTATGAVLSNSWVCCI